MRSAALMREGVFGVAVRDAVFGVTVRDTVFGVVRCEDFFATGFPSVVSAPSATHDVVATAAP
jgi:hypothetical protein